jgi:hypothetical protein
LFSVPVLGFRVCLLLILQSSFRAATNIRLTRRSRRATLKP